MAFMCVDVCGHINDYCLAFSCWLDGLNLSATKYVDMQLNELVMSLNLDEGLILSTSNNHC